ncbi:MAG: c-type cytochrome [Magnetococcales bacterium]|nr:c-type cytochrome [Magnetococcales bacterium]
MQIFVVYNIDLRLNMVNKYLLYLLAAFVVTSISGCLSSGEENSDKGQELANNLCRGCHNIKDTSKHARGPAFSGIFNQPAGSATGYRYHSDYLYQVRQMELIWNKESLDFFLKNPQKFLSKSTMVEKNNTILTEVKDGYTKQNFFTAWKHRSFKPIKSEKDRKDIIAYLEKISVK